MGMRMMMKNILQNHLVEVVVEAEGVAEVPVLWQMVVMKILWHQLLVVGVVVEAAVEAVEQPIMLSLKKKAKHRTIQDLRKICLLQPHGEKKVELVEPEVQEEAGVEVGEEERPQPVVRKVPLNPNPKKVAGMKMKKMVRRKKFRHADQVVERVVG